MKINDLRFKKQELTLDELECGRVYVSSRLQKYLLLTSEDLLVCLETGEAFDEDECEGDVFTPVEAELVIK